MRSLRCDGIKMGGIVSEPFLSCFYFAMLEQTNLQERKDGDSTTINNYTTAVWF
jgi:hypothetical protein